MIKRVYGLTPDQFDAMLTQQNNRCACCDRELETGQKRHIDHCHDTGRVRGILCRRCNVGLGMAEHNIERLRQMIAFLERHA
jgi:hypothetical protein